ncbi:MAG: hypothetical protein N2446_02670, partial [Elusimicrobiales bacterium]|nr:hypothetical protein [Elusimicrobiales bacterium]
MDKDIERIINDVSSIDTARMSLRWALEKISSLEKERDELKKNIQILETEKNSLSERLKSIEISLQSRLKTVEEKEDFYKKLEATLSLLGEGKLSIDDLIKKEARIEILRKELEEEYQKKFEELDIKQRNLIDMWNKRLLEVESQYAEKMKELQKKYDELKIKTQDEFILKSRELEDKYRKREEELNNRILKLESELREKEDYLEVLKEDIEKKYILKRQELEERFQRKSELLNNIFEKKLVAFEEEKKKEISEILKNFEVQKETLIQELNYFKIKYDESQKLIKELECEISELKEKYRQDLLIEISRREEEYRKNLESFEEEKRKIYEINKALLEKNSQLEKLLIDEKNKLIADYTAKLVEIEKKYLENENKLKSDYENKLKENEIFYANLLNDKDIRLKEIEAQYFQLQKNFDQ